MFKAIKEFFLGKPVQAPTVEVQVVAPYKVEVPVVTEVVVPVAPVVVKAKAPAKKPVVKAKTAKAPAKKPVVKAVAKKPAKTK